MFEPFRSAYIAFGKVAPIEVSEYPQNALADIFALQVIVGGLVFSGLAHFSPPFGNRSLMYAHLLILNNSTNFSQDISSSIYVNVPPNLTEI